MTNPTTTAHSRTARILAFTYGLTVYAFFLVVFIYAIAFVADASFVPKTIDRGGWGDGSLTATALLATSGCCCCSPSSTAGWPEPASNSG